MKSWGRLPMNMVQMWTNRRCDMVFTNMRMGQRPLSSCINIQSDLSTVTTIRSEKSEGLFGSIGNLLRGNRGGDTNNTVSSSHPNMQIFLPLISILAGTTTRRVQNPSTSSMALFTYLLPSLIRSLDCGYRYEYVLGYDKGDPFYDSDKVHNIQSQPPYLLYQIILPNYNTCFRE